jgi:hypothetical protein
MPRMDTERPRRSRYIISLLAACFLALASAVASPLASGDSSGIEGVWSFNGGEIAVQRAAGNGYTGTVVRETKFAECTHPVGQEIWKELMPQPDGSFWGFHEWYVQQDHKCLTEPSYVGPTAWRVVNSTAGTRFLEVCFSAPGEPQPTISASGATADASYGCSQSALLASLSSGTASFNALVTAPRARVCLSRRRLVIHVRDPKNDAFKSMSITIGGRHLHETRQGRYILATINLKGLPKGAFILHISGVTVQGRHLTGSRTYHTCTRKRARRRSRKR